MPIPRRNPLHLHLARGQPALEFSHGRTVRSSQSADSPRAVPGLLSPGASASQDRTFSRSRTYRTRSLRTYLWHQQSQSGCCSRREHRCLWSSVRSCMRSLGGTAREQLATELSAAIFGAMAHSTDAHAWQESRTASMQTRRRGKIGFRRLPCMGPWYTEVEAWRSVTRETFFKFRVVVFGCKGWISTAKRKCHDCARLADDTMSLEGRNGEPQSSRILTGQRTRTVTCPLQICSLRIRRFQILQVRASATHCLLSPLSSTNLHANISHQSYICDGVDWQLFMGSIYYATPSYALSLACWDDQPATHHKHKINLPNQNQTSKPTAAKERRRGRGAGEQN